uniref:C2H2-type domain-containing protein n=1 Tax=Macrostomum lignano TaxID=282301 RepID=A0A1I8GWE3_9PLAT
MEDQLIPSLSLSVFLVPYEETAGVKYNASATVLKRLRRCLLQLKSDLSHLLPFTGGLKTIEIETASTSESSSSSSSSDDLECDEAKELSRLSRVVFSLDVTSSQQLVQLKKFLDSGQLNLWLTEHVQPKVKGLKFFRVILGKAYYTAARRKLRSLEKRARKQDSLRARQQSGSSDSEAAADDAASHQPARRLRIPKVDFEFRLCIADVARHFLDQASKGENLSVDEEKALMSAVLNATCDMTASLVLTNTKRNQSSSIEYEITNLCDFYSLPAWRVFILAADIVSSEYCYELSNCDQPATFPDLKQMDAPYSAGVAATVSAAKISDIIVQNCPNRCTRLIDGALKEFETRPLNAGRRVCLDAFLRPYLQSIAREPALFWKIFAFHAASLAGVGSQTVLDNAEPSVFINQCCSVLIETWVESVITDKIAADGFGSLKPGGKLMLCRVSLHIHQRFEADGDTFWPKDAAQWLLQCLQQPDLGSVDVQSVFFLDSYLPSFLHLCHCAQLLHSSESPANFILLVGSLGFIERAADKFRAALAQFLLSSGLVREFNAANFVMIFSSMFDDAESNPTLRDLLIEFLTINEVTETVKAFESRECLSSSLLKLVKDCSSQVLFNKQLAEVKTQEWKPLCEITAKAKRLQCESLTLWHAEGVPVVRAAVIDSIGSEIENENSAANRRALSDLLSLSGLFDEQFALKFMSIVFSSDCQWLIKLCLDSFDSALLSHIEASDSDELPAVLAQFIRLSCDYYCKSTCSVVSFLLERSKNCHFQTVCLDCGKSLLAEQPLTKASIEINMRDAQNTSELLRIIFENFYQRISSSSSESDTDLILDWLQENAPAFSSEFLYKHVYKTYCAVLEKIIAGIPNHPLPTVFDLLPSLFEKSFLWTWMIGDSHSDIQSLKEILLFRVVARIECIKEFSKRLSAEADAEGVSLQEFNDFVCVFDSLEINRRAATNSSNEGRSYGLFDQLLAAFFPSAKQSKNTTQLVKFHEANVRSWNEQCHMVDEVFEILSRVSSAMTTEQARRELDIDGDTKFNNVQSVFREPWLMCQEFLRLDESSKKAYMPFEFRLYIADVVKFTLDEVLNAKRGGSDNQQLNKTLSTLLLSSKPLCEIFGLSLERLLSVQLSQHRQASAMELLPLLLEKNFMWMWMTSDSDPSIQPTADAVRLKLSSKLQCIADFARVFFNRDADKHLSLADFREFVATFERLEKSRKLVRGSIESSLYDYFDLLLKAFFVNFKRSRGAKEIVRFLKQKERNWCVQSPVVDQIFEVLFLISAGSSRLNLKLIDLEEKRSRYQLLKQHFSSSIGSFGSDDLVFQIFEIRNVQNLELMKSLVQSELFRRVFVRSKPASGGSRNLFEAESPQSAVYSRPGALITVQCSYVLDKMLPDALNSYKQLPRSGQRLSDVRRMIEMDSSTAMDVDLETKLMLSIGVPLLEVFNFFETPFEFRLYTADIVKFTLDEALNAKRGASDNQQFAKTLSTLLLNAKCDITI